jgi:hypothetical protein
VLAKMEAQRCETPIFPFGMPCLVEPEVPIANLAKHLFLEVHAYRQFLINRGLETVECIHHESPRCSRSVPEI